MLTILIHYSYNLIIDYNTLTDSHRRPHAKVESIDAKFALDLIGIATFSKVAMDGYLLDLVLSFQATGKSK